MKLTRINFEKLTCAHYSVNGFAPHLEDALTSVAVSQSNKEWVRSFKSPVHELRVYFYGVQEIGAIVDEVADIDTIKGWLEGLPLEGSAAPKAAICAAAPVPFKRDQTLLSANELAVMTAIDDSEYGDALTDSVWVFTIADNSSLSGKTISGTVSSLVKKGLVLSNGFSKDSAICMTAAGAEIYRTARGGTTHKKVQ